MSATSQQKLCDYCHQKPKFGTHDYCGKTCGQQAAAINQANGVGSSQPQVAPALCKQCNQKPKFQNFEFCGKNCASTWQLAHGGSNGNPNPPANNLSSGNLPGNAAANVKIPGQLLAHIPQPLQAQLQAVLPGLATSFQQQGQTQPQQQQQPPSVNPTTNIPQGPPSNVPQQSKVAATLAPNNPNANPPQQKNVNLSVNAGSGPGIPVPQNVQGPANGINNTQIPTSAPGQVQASAAPTTCLLNGCTKPVYTDPTTNHASEYCSKRHREEAVTTNQAKACIMCLKMPRSSVDHFCSKACRDAALSQ